MRRLLTIISVYSLLFAPLSVLAHGNLYFEFAPDPWASKRYIVASGNTPYQQFQTNDNLTLLGFDLWVDNTGEEGLVSFTLADSQGSTIDTVNISLPELPAIPGGNKLHVNLNSGAQLNSGETYSIKIDSSLFGFGIYYADRITFLEHNREFTSQYVNGVAKLGQVQQPFTFKFALRSEEINGITNVSADGFIATPTSTAQAVSISNARVAEVTDTTVTLAWTTNIAADSRASLRTQLNPLYVVATGYDPTYELEHTIVIGGLIPNVNYFADVFSTQGSELVLTTYTIGFKTLSAPTTPTTPPTTPANPTTPTTPPTPSTPSTPATPSTPSTPATPPTPSTPNTPTTPTNTQSPSDGTPGTSGSNETSGINITGAVGGAGADIQWPVGQNGEPTNGYRVDVFDYQHNLVSQFMAPAGTHSGSVKNLAGGSHTVIVYANNDGVFTKVALAKSFLVQSKDMNLTIKITVIVLLWIGTWTFYFWRKFKKEKNVLPPEEGYNPNG